MKIGLVYCGYNIKEYVTETITPWVEAKEFFEIKIAAVALPFKEYLGSGQGEDGTVEILSNLLAENKIDFLYTEPKYIQEHIARNLCLFAVLAHNPDIVIMVDGDEFYTVDSIKRIVEYIEKTPEVDCYEIDFKNYVFDGKQWIDGFHPFRIFKNNKHGGINQFYWDNDIIFNNRTTHKQSNFITIPREVAHIKHMTWLNDERSRLKMEYQTKKTGGCSYVWNSETKSLSFDYAYYDKYGYERPNLFRDEDSIG